MPIFYTPYITFPISDQRKSGFLPPTIGSSGDSSFDFTLPYYWNIAPERDATFAPRILGDRGVLLGGQYRYLVQRGDGQLDAEYLPVDSERDDDARWLIGYTHEQRFAGHRGHLFLEFNRVSDEQYFDDFGTSLALTSRRFLEQQADARYSGDLWNVLARVQGFQPVDATVRDEPYDRLPQVFFNAYTPRREGGFNYRYTATALFPVAPQAFRPEPQVHSTVIRLVPRPPAISVADPGLFERLVRQAFGQRRKKLRNALRGWLDEGAFGRAGIDPTLRAETLAVADFVRLANDLARGI